MYSDELKTFPEESGVYMMLDKKKRVLYVGKAKNLRARLKQYFNKDQNERPTIGLLMPQVESIETIVVSSEKEALILENNLIKKHHPKYNILLKDDKTYICIRLSIGAWPKLEQIRAKNIKEPYFGPYTNALAAKQTLHLILRLFPLRQCSDAEFRNRTRPCILYEMGRCLGPCCGKCSPDEYKEAVQSAAGLLKGQNKTVIKALKAAMKRASGRMEYEKAAALHKQIEQIRHVTEVQHVDNLAAKNCDAIGLFLEKSRAAIVKLHFEEGKLVGSTGFSFNDVIDEKTTILEAFICQHYSQLHPHVKEILLPQKISSAAKQIIPSHIKLVTPSRGEKLQLIKMAEANAKAYFFKEQNCQQANEELLLQLQKRLGLKRYPKRIECIDISTTQGKETTAAIAAFTNAKREKAKTRFFNIPPHITGDTPSMEHALERHFTRTLADPCDLLIVDGGKHQLNAALRVLKKMEIVNIEVIGIAKEMARHDKGLSRERIFLPGQQDPIVLERTSKLLFFLQKIRDEAHRLAIGLHRTRREQNLSGSALDKLKNIGPIKKQRLLAHFGSPKKIFTASKEELLQIKGITKADADQILSG